MTDGFPDATGSKQQRPRGCGAPLLRTSPDDRRRGAFPQISVEEENRRMTQIVCRQLAPEIGNLAANRALAQQAIEESVRDGGQIVVLPELMTSGYVFESRSEAESVAVRPDHELFADWAALAAKGSAVVIGGFCETRPE